MQSAADSMAPLTKLGYRLTTKLPDIPYGESVEKWNTFVSRAKNTHGTACAEAVPYIPDETAVITYTGGTTGFPKGVMLTNDGMNTVALNFAYAGLHYDRGDRFLDIMPVFSSYGVVCGLHMPLTLGLENVVIPRFEASKLGALIRKYKCNHMLAVPAFYEMVMSDPKMKHYDLSFMRMLGTGGDTMNPALEEKLYNFMREHGIPNPPAQGYGMSEVHAAASFNFESTYRPGSVGIPSLKTTISIFRPETTEELDIGEEGEVCISGPTIMKGYYKGEAETDYVMKRHPDGQLWVHSGDIGYMDEDGFVYVKGRVKHMIIRFDGHKVFPIQMETFLSAHPAVRNAAVIGVPDRAHGQGQLPLAVVELDDGHKDKEKADALCRELFDSCNETLEERGRPVAVVAVDKMPITGLGKNDIRSLTEQYREYKY
ncbi:MAG: long-chain fatty acid--CoA ligase [Clostridia bacterium]|nr:long-chain fatty acid--CoA ligase [Clostridia bacterium]